MKFIITLLALVINSSLLIAQVLEPDVKPEFPGGQAKLYELLREKFEYPEIAYENLINGTVSLQFFIDKSGVVSKVLVVQSLHPEIDQKLQKLITELPNWKPARYKSKAVGTYYLLHIPIPIKEDDYESYDPEPPIAVYKKTDVQQPTPDESNSEFIESIKSKINLDRIPPMTFHPDSIHTYVADNIIFPIEAEDNHISGEMNIKITVSEKGRITNVKVLNGLGYGIDEEVVRLLLAYNREEKAEFEGSPIVSNLKMPLKLSSVDPPPYKKNPTEQDMLRASISYNYRKAIKLIEDQKYEKAIKFLNKLIALDDGYGKAYYRKGQAFLSNGNTKDACNNFKKAIELGINVTQDIIDEVCE